jgi:hypothetical protein
VTTFQAVVEVSNGTNWAGHVTRGTEFAQFVEALQEAEMLGMPYRVMFFMDETYTGSFSQMPKA